LKLQLLFPAAAVLLVLSAACGGSSTNLTPSAAAEASFPLIIDQSDGQKLTLERRPQRIVSLAAHATEIFCAVGAGDQLVAVDRFANCPLGSKAKPEVDGFRPSVEAIAGYRPDLVYVSSNRGEIVQSLRQLNIPILFIELPNSLDGVISHILTLSRAAGHESDGKALTAAMQRRIDAIKARVGGDGGGPRVYYELTTDYFSAAPNSFVGDFYKVLQAQNIAAGAATQYPQLSAAVIIQRNPEVIVLADEAAGVTAASVRARPGWAVVDAVKSNRICIIDPDIVSRPGPRVVDALEALARCLYPQRFS